LNKYTNLGSGRKGCRGLVTKATAEQVRRVCEPETLGFAHTDELPSLEGIIGQERAVRALHFGLGIKEQGFNVFVAGPPGTGKITAVENFIEELAAGQPVPSDWCYVHNFRQPQRPRALELPTGRGAELQEDLHQIISLVQRDIRRAFNSEEYGRRRTEQLEVFAARRNELLNALGKAVHEKGFALQVTPVGFMITPLVEGRMVKEEEFMSLPAEVREGFARRKDQLQGVIQDAMRQLGGVEREAREALEKLDREVAEFVVVPLVAPLQDKYGALSEVREYLDEVRDDLLKNYGLFKEAGFDAEPREQKGSPSRTDPVRKYEVNVLVDNSGRKGAPVVMEVNPSVSNLVGRIDREAQFGALVTDFTMIRAGSLHNANGGYLVIPVDELLKNPQSWSVLKRAMRNEKISIEDFGDRVGILSAKSLQPEPVPFRAKVVLLGSPELYRLFYLLDPEFQELFKVKAEFDSVMPRNPENVRKYAAFFATLCRKEGLRHIDVSGIARLVEYGSRMAEDQEMLSARFADIADVVREANHYALSEGAEYILSAHIQKAVDERLHRVNLVQEKLAHWLDRGLLLVETDGDETGQVNALTVIDLGDISFGRPVRVTASVAAGRSGVVDIERESRLGGPLHTKGVLILGGFLSERFGRDEPLTLAARLVFEQSYSGVDGDSASVAELAAIVSALTGVPVRQGIAVTGSMNQKGRVQAVGGVNDKVEGFFDLCRARGLTGRQGVVIPRSNVQNLMLKEEVIEAVRAGQFAIFPVETVDEALSVLTGEDPRRLQALAEARVKALREKAHGNGEKETVSSRPANAGTPAVAPATLLASQLAEKGGGGKAGVGDTREKPEPAGIFRKTVGRNPAGTSESIT